MVTNGRRKGTTRFAVKPDNGARSVKLAGDFNGWRPATMRRRGDGSYVTVVALRPGSYEYKLLFDGRWATDPDNHAWAMNPYGTLNSVARVG